MVSQVRDRCNMCAGRCREPRRKGARVAAPSGCIVPWAARASCWPQPQQLLPVSAAGSGRRCCTGAFPRRTIRRVDAVRIHPCSPFCKTDKTETPVPGSDTGVLGGRGWIRTSLTLTNPRFQLIFLWIHADFYALLLTCPDSIRQSRQKSGLQSGLFFAAGRVL